MASIENSIFCDGCGVEITWSPVVIRQLKKGVGLSGRRVYTFCCQACADGLPCTCAERMELEDDRRSGSATGETE